MSKYENVIKIIFDKNSMDRYNTWYLKNNPRAKKPPIDSPIPPTLNVFTAKKRITQNAMKQRWKAYVLWRLDDIGLKCTNIDKCDVEYHFIMPSRRRSDLDNLGSISSKFVNDAITESGLLWGDDSFDIIESLRFSAEYIKDIRELHITITY